MAQRDSLAASAEGRGRVVLEGHRNPLARAEFDRGAVEPEFPLQGIMVNLQRSPGQQADLDRLLAAQHDPASPDYRKWLTPEEFGNRFGASAHDLAAVRQWLEQQGFQVKAQARSRMFLRFDATAETVRSAFGTEIHRYLVGGEMHFANASAPSVPAALAPLVSSVTGLDDFFPKPHLVSIPSAGNEAAPFFNWGTSSHALAPGDLATIYDIEPLYQAGLDGTGESVVIVSASDVTLSDIALYRTTFGLVPGSPIEVIHPEAAPGLLGGEWGTEVDLDLEMVSAVAPNAHLVLEADANVWNAITDAVDNNRGQIISMSFGGCEPQFNPPTIATMRANLQQGNAQGITAVASSGDSGAAGCDIGTLTTSAGAHQGIAVNLPAAYPEVTGVGGTEFVEGAVNYWGAAKGANGGSALLYIPEIAWNDSALDLASSKKLAATGGGASTLYSKPVWQTGTGVPNDNQRDVPDVALAASWDHDGYVIVAGGKVSTQAMPAYTYGGTSASAPVFAGIVALLDQSLGTGTRTGNINANLYTIAANATQNLPPFHDIVGGDNKVPCVSGSTDCPAQLQFGFLAGPGYDQTTGLGSIDAFNLQQAWAATYGAVPAIALLSPSAVAAGSDNTTVTITGTGFTGAAVVVWTFENQTSLLGAQVASATSLTVTVPAGLLTTKGTAQINIMTATASSAPAVFDVGFPAAIASIAPSSITAGSTGFTLTVNGFGFASGAKIIWNETPLTTTFVSSSKLTGAITSAMISSASSIPVTVVNADGTTTAAAYFTINPGAAGIATLSPVLASAGGPQFTLTVNGTNFYNGSTVVWGNIDLVTMYIGPNQLAAIVPAAQLATAGSVTVTVLSVGGAKSGGSAFTVKAPTISSLSQTSAVAGTGAFILTVTGTNFVVGSTVMWNSTALPTAYGSATSLTAVVEAAQLATSGAVNITVKNTSAVSSLASAFSVSGPTISSLSQTSIAAGSSGLTLTLTGTNYLFTSTVMWGTTAVPTWYGGSTSLVAVVPGTSLATAGSVKVTVQNTATAVSSASTFTVNGPTVASLSPSTVVAGAPAATLTVTGTNFIPGTLDNQGGFTAGSIAYWGTTALTVTAGTATSITAIVPANLFINTGKDGVTVKNPGGAASASTSVTVNGPVIVSLNQTSAAAGSAGFTLAVTGSNFVSGSTVMWNTTALATSYGSATSLTATVTNDQLAAVSAVRITVKNTSGASSAASTFIINAPGISSLTPSSLVAGGSATTLTVAGKNFIAGSMDNQGDFTPGSTVYWNTTALTVTAGTAASITATIPANLLTSAGKVNVMVKNPGGAMSTASTLIVYGPAIASLSSTSLVAGSPGAAITVTGTNFIAGTSNQGNFTPGSVVYWGTNALTVTAGTATSITASIPASLLTAVGKGSMTVQNPGGAASSVSTVVVNGPSIVSLSPTSFAAGSLDTSLTVTGTNFIAGTSNQGNFTPGSLVYWGTTGLTVTAGTATAITATVPASQIAMGGSASITVINPGGAASKPVSVAVAGPMISSLSPATIPATSPSFTLTVNGKNFVAGSRVLWGTALLNTTVVSTTQLTAMIAASQIANAGVVGIAVTNMDGSTSTANSFTVSSPPTLVSLSPASAAHGGAQITVTVTGTNFASGATVMWGPTALATTYLGTTKLTAVVPAASIANAGPVGVTVVLAAGATTSATQFTVN